MKGHSYLIVDGVEVRRKGWRDVGDAEAQLLGEAEFYILEQNASVAHYYGVWRGIDDILLATIIKTVEGKLEVVGGKGDITVCVGCGGLENTSHKCIRGEKNCSQKYYVGTYGGAQGCRPKDHPCAALFHAELDGLFFIEIDNPQRLPNIPEWELIQEWQTGGRGHHLYYYARQGFTPEQLVEFFQKNHPTEAFKIINDNHRVVIFAENLGPWIGKGGRWAKAYRKLGINVQFRDATLVDLNEINEDGQKKQIRDMALWVREIATQYNVTIGALIPGKHNLPSVFHITEVRSDC